MPKLEYMVITILVRFFLPEYFYIFDFEGATKPWVKEG